MTDKLNTIISFLAEFCKARLLEEKIFVVPSYQLGHQLGEALTQEGYSWVNLNFATLPSLAQEIAGAELTKLGIKQISGSTSLFIVDKIFRSLKDKGKLDYFAELEASSGIIRAVCRSIHSLRMAGLRSKDLSPDSFIQKNKGNEVILFLNKYEEELEKEKLIDLPGTYFFALEKPKGNQLDEKKIYLCLQEIAQSRLERAFLEKIAGKHLILIPQDPVYGIPRPRRLWKIKEEIAAPSSEAHNDKKGKKPKPSTDLERTSWLFAPQDSPPPLKDKSLELFRAIGPTNECREILSRIIAEKIPLDDIEIIHPPGSTYPSLFYVLSAKTGIKVTYAEGVAITFTSPGKVFNGVADWLESDFQVSDLCRMIEGGDLKFPREKELDTPSSLKISRYLKSAMIGWNRTRYLPRLETLIKSIEENAKSAQEEGEEEKAKKLKANIKEVEWLTKVIKQFLNLIPLWDKDGVLEFSALCQGVSEFIKKFSRIHNDLDREAYSLISSRLEEAASVGVSFLQKEEAFERLRNLSGGLCVGASGPMPSHLHLSSYSSGGYSGRPVTFIVGLDQGRFPGTGLQDPILLDEEKEKISKELATTSDSLRENIYSMAGLISSLRGRAILSYSSYDLIEERQSFPSSLMLQAYRLLEGKASLDYSALNSFLPESSGFLPKELDKVFDEIDWWLSELKAGDRLLDGLETVKEQFPELGRGIYAKEIRSGSKLSAYEGRVAIDPKEAHPFWNPDIIMSSSRIELLARCPFGYFLQYILDVQKPEELEFDQSRWLNPMKRGLLVHDILFKFMKEMVKRKKRVDPSKHKSLIRKVAEEIVSHYREEIPPPSQGIFERERQEVMATLDVFLAAEKKREEKVEPLLFEVSFGFKEPEGEGIEDPVKIEMHPLIRFFLRGKIDRIDRVGEHVYRVVDYKTGSYSIYEDLVQFGRGRILQHAIYSIAAEQIIKKRGIDTAPEVIQSGYYFPTRKGDGREILVERFDRTKLSELLLELLNILSIGNFVVSPEVDCSYCDYKPICGEEAPKKAKEKQEYNVRDFKIFSVLDTYE